MKHATDIAALDDIQVAPFTGAWIETFHTSKKSKSEAVAPFTGAWIETYVRYAYSSVVFVAPFTGAWIETPICSISISHFWTSLPSRERGLKPS